MKQQITYADREWLLQTFEKLRDSSDRSDVEVMAAATDWAMRQGDPSGFDFAWARDILLLSRYLSEFGSRTDIGRIAKGALLYAIRSDERRAQFSSELQLLDVAFLCSYAVHEIRSRLGNPAVYSPPRLTVRERELAEEIFLRFLEEESSSDSALLSQVRKVLENLQNLLSCSLFRRFKQNLEFLSSVLVDFHRSEESRAYARGALVYVVCEEDAIDDRFGLIGFLDDMFISQLAVDLIDPQREPWLEILDHLVAAWPFILDLAFDDGSGPRPVSEFMMVNTVLACSRVRPDGAPSSLFLVLPRVGPVPLLLGLLYGIGLISDSSSPSASEITFEEGQKVLVDGSSFAEFCGYRVFSGRKMFGLKQFHRRKGHNAPCVHYWPISDMVRLLPADPSRTTRGKLSYERNRAESGLPALDHFHSLGGLEKIQSVQKQVVLVSNVGSALEYCRTTTLYGTALCDVLPLGHLSSDQTIRHWSSRFGEISPLVLTISDLDQACAYCEKNHKSVELIIIDTRGRNSGKVASMKRLQSLGTRLIAAATETQTGDFVDGTEQNVAVWEWQPDDFDSLIWPSSLERSKGNSGLVSQYEGHLKDTAPYAPEIHVLQLPIADETFNVLRELKELVSERGDEQLPELEEILRITLSLMSRLLRSGVTLQKCPESNSALKDEANRLRELRLGSGFLTTSEAATAEKAEEAINELLEVLSNKNPKEGVIQSLLEEGDKLPIICPDSRLIDDIRARHGVQVLSTVSNGYNLRGAIIPGWFGKDRMSRLLIPPITRPLHLVLFNVECSWHDSFVESRRRMRNARLELANRAALFPQVEGWRRPKKLEPKASAQLAISRASDLEDIQGRVNQYLRQTIYRRAEGASVDSVVSAKLLIFDSGIHAFLTSSYRANVVTHLIDRGRDTPEQDQEIKRLAPDQITVGDSLLFHRGSSSDVIRTEADKILPSGVRERSSLWRRVLLEWSDKERISPEEVWTLLREFGCPLHPQTIRTWFENELIIAPQAFKRDIPLIARVTGSHVLGSELDQIFEAIRVVRSAHLSVSRRLAKKIVDRAANILLEESDLSSILEITEDVVIARIVDIDSKESVVKYSLVNRLLEEDLWPA